MSDKTEGAVVDPSSTAGAEQKPKSTWRDLLELAAVFDLPGIIILIVFVIPAAAMLWCLGLSLDQVRQYVNRPQPEWSEMSARRKAMRLLLTAVGTVVLASPFIWFGWLLMT